MQQAVDGLNDIVICFTLQRTSVPFRRYDGTAHEIVQINMRRLCDVISINPLWATTRVEQGTICGVYQRRI